jgi:hypothetical protein
LLGPLLHVRVTAPVELLVIVNLSPVLAAVAVTL